MNGRCKISVGRVIHFLVVLAITWGCSDAGLVGGDCHFGLSPCDGICVNLGDDAENCGACGRTCDAEQSCQSGLCLPAADAGAEAP